MASDVAVKNLLTRDAPSLIRSVVRGYFAPLSFTLDYAKKQILNRRSLRAVSDCRDDSEQLITFVHKAVCYNQGALVQFCFIAAQKHKALKEGLRTDKDDVKGHQLRFYDLVNFLNEALLKVSLNNFELLRSYYSSRSDVAPRVCLKGNFDVKSDTTATIVALFRDNPVGYNSNFSVEGNSGFRFVRDCGRYYLENDIPQAVVRNAYINPRLNVSDVQKAYRSSGENLLHIRREWETFWKRPAQKIKNDPSCYKSTLIIPLTFWNNELSEDFKRAVNIDKFERAILGYLCIDHRDVDFFDDKIDVAVGYIFADILSVYVFNRLVYTNISDTYRKATAGMKKLDEELFPEKMEEALSKLWSRGVSILESPDLKLVETTNNQLVGTDANLFDYASGK